MKEKILKYPLLLGSICLIIAFIFSAIYLFERSLLAGIFGRIFYLAGAIYGFIGKSSIAWIPLITLITLIIHIIIKWT
jgi:hypothetical protein